MVSKRAVRQRRGQELAERMSLFSQHSSAEYLLHLEELNGEDDRVMEEFY